MKAGENRAGRSAKWERYAKSSTRGYFEAVICGFGNFMSLMDGSLSSVVAPHVQQVMNLSQSDRQWLTTAPTFAMGAALLCGGRAVDYFGAKLTFVMGALGYAIASAAAGLSMNGLQMISFRIAQGFFGALLIPASLAILSSASSDAGPRAKNFALLWDGVGNGPADRTGSRRNHRAIDLLACVPLRESHRGRTHCGCRNGCYPSATGKKANGTVQYSRCALGDCRVRIDYLWSITRRQRAFHHSLVTRR